MRWNFARDTRTLALRFAVVTVTALVVGVPEYAQNLIFFAPANLVVSRSVYNNNAKNVVIGQTLPPNCTNSCVTAINDGTYPTVWNNNLRETRQLPTGAK